MQSVPERTCRKCAQTYPATLEHFPPQGANGLRWTCRLCVRAYSKQHAKGYARARPEPKPKKIHLKTCRDCCGSFPLTAEFFARSAPYCRTCGHMRLQKSILQAKARSGALLSHRTCSHCSETKLNSPEFFYAGASNTCKECWKARTRRDHHADPLRRRARTAKRRARLLQAGGAHGPADIRRQFAQQKGKCYWCQAVLQVEGEDKYHVDHLIALAKGGTNGPENIVCACRACNGTKAAKMPWEFNGRLL